MVLTVFGIYITSPDTLNVKPINRTISRSVSQQAPYFSPLQTEPYLFLRDKNDSSSYTGYIPALLDKLTSLAGYSYTLNLVQDNKYGSQDVNGSWDGLVGELVNKVLSQSVTLSVSLSLSLSLSCLIDSPSYSSFFFI